MHLLLINDNPAVSRLVTLSAEKMGHSVTEINDFDSFDGNKYEITFVDSELYNSEAVDMFKNMGLSSHLVYVGSRGSEKPINMDSMVEKPFLPTDLISLITKIEGTLDGRKEEPLNDDEDEILAEENLEESIEDFNVENDGFVELESSDDEDILNEIKDMDENIDDEQTPLAVDNDFGGIGEDNDDLQLDDEDFTNKLSFDEHVIDEELEDDLEDILNDDLEGGEDSFEEKPILDTDDIEEVKNLLDEEENDDIEDVKSDLEDSEDSDLYDAKDSFANDEEADEEENVDELLAQIETMDEDLKEDEVAEDEEDIDLPDDLNDLFEDEAEKEEVKTPAETLEDVTSGESEDLAEELFESEIGDESLSEENKEAA